MISFVEDSNVPFHTVRLLNANSVAEGITLSFQFSVTGGTTEEGFALRLSSGWVAYSKTCPHWSVPIDVAGERFYRPDDDRIYCTCHGAQFEPETGRCDGGPCFGEFLERFEVCPDGDDLLITIRRSITINAAQ